MTKKKVTPTAYFTILLQLYFSHIVSILGRKMEPQLLHGGLLCFYNIQIKKYKTINKIIIYQHLPHIII